MSKLIMEQATFMIVDSCETRFALDVNGQGEVNITCAKTGAELDMDFEHLKFIYDAVTAVYSEESS